MKHNTKYQSEEQLIKGCKKQDPVAMEAIYLKYSKKMFGVCLRYTKTKEEAEDILQESFIKVFGKIKGFRSEGALEGWIRRIVIHTALNHYRKAGRIFPLGQDVATQLPSATADILDVLSADELTALIREMPAGYRTIFNLFAVEGYSHKEIAATLEIAEGTSKSQYARAKSFLQQKLKQIKHHSLEKNQHGKLGK